MKPNKTIAKIEICQRLGQNSISQGKSKRVRTIFTPEQLEKLEVEFERQQYMVGPERLYLASALNLSEAQVKVWFQVKHFNSYNYRLIEATNIRINKINCLNILIVEQKNQMA
jgi:hypothetical protein